jgi:hypothetical protein
MKIILAVFLSISLTTVAHSAPQDVAKALFPKTVLITWNDPAGSIHRIGKKRRLPPGDARRYVQDKMLFQARPIMCII